MKPPRAEVSLNSRDSYWGSSLKGRGVEATTIGRVLLKAAKEYQWGRIFLNWAMKPPKAEVSLNSRDSYWRSSLKGRGVEATNIGRVLQKAAKEYVWGRIFLNWAIKPPRAEESL
ncbi:hypothetical protein GE061_010998 [Apolygus lucorum]|uniref:Uncharacterized protein n=1 Tax=Apolygus lucorum TaxID=248454 RepID=A0A8S9XW57_APOLU|nr:hypothetical protein GE061_010998 [Apolygus lucorum]